MPTEHRKLIAELLTMYRKQSQCESISLDNPNAVNLGIKLIEHGNKIIHPPIPIYNQEAVMHYLAQSWRINCFVHYRHLQPRHVQMAIDALTELSKVLQVVYKFLHMLDNNPPLYLIRTELMADNIKRFHPMPVAHQDPRLIKVLLNREMHISWYEKFYQHYADRHLNHMISWHIETFQQIKNSIIPTNNSFSHNQTLYEFFTLIQKSKPLPLHNTNNCFPRKSFDINDFIYRFTQALTKQNNVTTIPQSSPWHIHQPINCFIAYDPVIMLQEIIAFACQSGRIDIATNQLHNNPYYTELKELICDELCHEGPLSKTDLYNFTL